MTGYPEDLLKQLSPDDKVVLFEGLDLVDISNGCMGPKKISRPGGYIAVTERRLVIKATDVKTTTVGNKVETTASLRTLNVPIDKVSSITLEETKQVGGCLSKSETMYGLLINVQGGFYNIYTGITPRIADEFLRSYISLQD